MENINIKRDFRYEENPTYKDKNIEGKLDFLVELMPESTTLAAFKLLVVVSKLFDTGYVIMDRTMAEVIKCSERTYYHALNQLLDNKVIFRSTIYNKYWINQGKLKDEE